MFNKGKKFFLTLSLVLLLVVVLVSCQKQNSSSIFSDEVRSTRELERLEACTHVNFNKGVLLHNNIQQLFICTKWSEQYPHFYDSISKISQASWDHLMEPFDQSFIENRFRRDRFFRHMRDLDKKNGLDDLGYVITSLNEKNFFDSLKLLFLCVENPYDDSCKDRQGRIPTKRTLKNLLQYVDMSPQSLDNLSRLIKVAVQSLQDNREPLRYEINRFRGSPLYIPMRLKVIDSLAEKVKTGLTDEDRSLMAKLFLTAGTSGDTSWFYEWMQDSKLTRDKFRDLLEFPILTNPNLVAEFQGIKKLYDDGMNCSIRSNNAANDLIEFDLKNQIYNYANIIKSANQQRFFEYSSNTLVGMKMSSEICKELESNRYNVNLNHALANLMKFMGEKKFYDLAKYMVSQTTVKGDINKSMSENLYMADMLAGKIFATGNEFNSLIVKNTRDFYPLMFDILRKVDADSYITLGQTLEASTKIENDPTLRAFAEFWLFFKPEEKNFLFNFVDHHFDLNRNYPALFEFYSKFLDDFREVQPIFRDKWLGTPEREEMSYLTVQEMVGHLDGVEALAEFRKFFSRDQIIKVVEVLSKGQDINRMAQEELEYIRSDRYVLKARSQPYRFKVSYNSSSDDSYDSKVLIECVDQFNRIENGLYQLIRNLPQACTKITNENISFRLFGWLNSIESAYLNFKTAINGNDSLLDDKGLMSPYMLNSTIALTKVLDGLLGPADSTLPTTGGINYLMNSTNYYLNHKRGAPLLESNLQWFNKFLLVSPDQNIQHRNALIKTFTREENFNYSKIMVNNFANLIDDYGQWVQSGQYDKALKRSLGSYDPNSDCQKVLNGFVAPNPCPSKDLIKIYGNSMIQTFHHIWEDDQGSPVAQLLKAVKAGEGLSIPLNGKKSIKYRMSLEELFRYLYDTSDKSWAINREKVKFVNENNQASTEEVTTLERVESVIREVRFDNNYLGVSFLNALVHGDNYNKDAAGKKSLMSKCINIPIIHCGRLMSKSDHRMGLNALEMFDSLLDVNNGRGLEPRMQFGNFLKTFEQSLVASSAYGAQKVQLLPLRNELLEKHNGTILGDMTMLSTWSNSARVIRDRVGRSRAEFESFINSDNFKRVDRALLNGFDLPIASKSAERLLAKLQSKMPGESQNLFGNSVDWVAGLSYEETRLVEDTLARLMVVGSYLGTPEVVFGTPASESVATTKYANNNLFQLFLAAEKVIDYWPVLKNNLPIDVKLIDVIKPINTALYYFTLKLNSSNDWQKNTAYLALNDLFVVLQTSLFDELPNAQIGAAASTTNGLNLILEVLKDSKLVSEGLGVVRADYKFSDNFYQNGGLWFKTVALNLKRVASSEKVDLTPMRDYLAFTSKNKICLTTKAKCESNYHYDEPAQLVRFLIQKNQNGQSYFNVLNQKLFIENTEQINRMLGDLLPAIIIKDKKPFLYL